MIKYMLCWTASFPLLIKKVCLRTTPVQILRLLKQGWQGRVLPVGCRFTPHFISSSRTELLMPVHFVESLSEEEILLLRSMIILAGKEEKATLKMLKIKTEKVCCVKPHRKRAALKWESFITNKILLSQRSVWKITMLFFLWHLKNSHQTQLFKKVPHSSAPMKH